MKQYNMVIICTIGNVIYLKSDAAESTFISWARALIVCIIFWYKGLETHCTNIPLFFARPLIYSICISVLLFPNCERRFSDLILLVYGFCSIPHEWVWLAYRKYSPINLFLLCSILDLLKMHFIVELWR